VNARLDGFLNPHAHLWFLRNAGVDPFQPMVPPAKRLLQKADCRTRSTVVRIPVAPGTDKPLAYAGIALNETENRVPIAVSPPANHEYRTSYRTIILADRALFPVIVSSLVCKPRLDE